MRVGEREARGSIRTALRSVSRTTTTRTSKEDFHAATRNAHRRSRSRCRAPDERSGACRRRRSATRSPIANIDKVKDLVSPGMEWCSTAGRSPSPRPKIAWPKAYKEATEKYSSQVKLTPDGLDVEDYVAGLPFPQHRPEGSAGRVQDHVELQLSATRHRRRRPAELRRRHRSDRDHASDARRAPLPARPLPPPLLRPAASTSSRSRRCRTRTATRAAGALYPIIEPFDLKGVGHLQPLHRLRRSRTTRGSTCRRSAACAGSRPRSAPTRSSGRTPTSTATTATPATSPGWTGSTSARRKSSARSTARTSRSSGPTAVDWAFDDVWEKRKVYVVEGVSKLPQYAYSKRVLYIDKEACAIPYTRHLRPLGRALEDLDQQLQLPEEAFPAPSITYRRDGLRSRRSSWSTCSSSTRPGVAAEPALPGRAGLVLQPG